MILTGMDWMGSVAKKKVYLVETKSKKGKKVYLVETKSKSGNNDNDIDWDGLDRFTIPKDSKEITTEPVEKKLGCACGVKSYNEINAEISGGTEAKPHEFPWMVRISGGCAGGELQIGIFQEK